MNRIEFDCPEIEFIYFEDEDAVLTFGSGGSGTKTEMDEIEDEE